MLPIGAVSDQVVEAEEKEESKEVNVVSLDD